MSTSYNGWTASPDPKAFGGLDNRDIPGAPGVKVAPGVRSGDIATVLFHFASLFDQHIEELHAGQCWGYDFRPDTNNRAQLSCHASGTAIDLNAPEHPNGKRGTYSQVQVNTLRALLAGYDGVIAWGGDFTGTDDEMHFEIKGSTAQVAAVAAKLTGTPAPAPAPAPAGHHDATGRGESFRAELGDQGIEVAEMQHDLNRYGPAYSHLAEDGVYGPATEAVVAEFAHREAKDPTTPAGDRAGLASADGENVGPRLAHALAQDGLI